MNRLSPVFTDPSKVKVLHGADSDILWLQRDFGLHIVNMFDTGQASRVLGLPRFSLAYLYKQYWSAERVFPRRAPIATGILNAIECVAAMWTRTSSTSSRTGALDH